MTPEQEHDYQKALRRIQEAKENKSVELDLSGLAHLTRFPPELAGLTSLQSLSLSEDFQFSGDLSPLAALTSLQSFDLTRCYGLSDLSPLAKLASLRELNLSVCNRLSDLSPLADLKSLQSLNLSECTQLSDLSPLVELTSLQKLNLSRCDGLSDLSPLAALTSLQSLNLQGCNQLSGNLSPLAGLASLQSLNLPGCDQLSGDLRPLAALTSLQSLNLFWCNQLSGNLSPLAGLASLQSLNLFGCEQLSGDLSPLAALKSLQSLDLSWCQQLSGNLSPLAGLTSLQSLNLTGCNRVNDLSPLAALTSLQSLDLSSCHGIRRFAPIESLLHTLKGLRLYGCHLDDLPIEVCGDNLFENVLDKVRNHYKNLESRSASARLKSLIFAPNPITKDFFISYTNVDQPWAEWIGWTLEEAGYSTVIQVWDFRPGSNFVLEMQKAATEADRTIAVLSQKYLESAFTQPEWAAAFAQDPQGKKQKLIPIRIDACQLTGILSSIIYLDLVGLPENDARTALLGAFKIRNKPTLAPAFPGTCTPQTSGVSLAPAPYPGATQTSSPSIAETLPSVAQNADQSHQLSPQQRLQLLRKLNAILAPQFNMLVVVLNPEPGLIPEMPAPQADRSAALFKWAESPGGCGLSALQQLLDAILNPQ